MTPTPPRRKHNPRSNLHGGYRKRGGVLRRLYYGTIHRELLANNGRHELEGR